MEKDSAFKQNVWNIMYGRKDSSENSASEDEGEITTPVPKPLVKTYSVLPPPDDYIPPAMCDVKDDTQSTDSDDEMEKPRRKRRRKKENSDQSVHDRQAECSKPEDKLTKNQKRKLKKKRRKEKQKSEAVAFTFVPEEKPESKMVITDVEKMAHDLINFFDAVWDVFKLQEMKTSGEKCQVFNNLNISLKSLCSENKADIELIQRLHKIKRLMLLGDRKTAGELIADL